MSAIELKFEDGKISVSSSELRRDENVVLTSAESRAAKIVEEALAEIGVSTSQICYKRNSQSYFSVVTHEVYDFLRIKIGDRAAWFTVFLSPMLRKELASDPRFNDQKNKRQLHWKVMLMDADDLANYKDLIQYGYQSAVWSFQKSNSD